MTRSWNPSRWFRGLFEWWRQHRPQFLALLAVTLGLTVTSGVVTHVEDRPLLLVAAVALCTNIVFVGFFVLLEKYPRLDLFRSLRMTGWRSSLLPAALIALSAVFVCVASYVGVEQYLSADNNTTVQIGEATDQGTHSPSSKPKETLVHKLMVNPGAIVGVVGTFLSFLGLYLAATSVKELRQIITTFRECSFHLLEMLKESQEEGDIVHILCYTPLPGSLALPRDKYKALMDKLCDTEIKIDAIVLEQTDLEQWLHKFKGKRKSDGQEVTNRNISSAVSDCNKFFDSRRRHEDVSDEAGGVELKENQTLRKRFVQMPDFYLFFNQRKAIVVSPFFIPRPDPFPLSNAIESEVVQLVGFVTTDPLMREQIEKVYTRYRNADIDIECNHQIHDSSTDIRKICDDFFASNDGSQVAAEFVGWAYKPPSAAVQPSPTGE